MHLLLALKTLSALKFARVRCFKQLQEKQTLRVPVYAGFKLARKKTLHFELASLHTASCDIAELQSTHLKFLPIHKNISAKAALENRQ